VESFFSDSAYVAVFRSLPFASSALVE